MYGTIAKMRLKPGMDEQMAALAREYETLHVPGFIAEYTYRLDEGSNLYMLAVVFEDRESYFANANSAQQDKFYRRMLVLLEGEPEWHDGEIVAVSQGRQIPQ